VSAGTFQAGTWELPDSCMLIVWGGARELPIFFLSPEVASMRYCYLKCRSLTVIPYETAEIACVAPDEHRSIILLVLRAAVRILRLRVRLQVNAANEAFLDRIQYGIVHFPTLIPKNSTSRWAARQAVRREQHWSIDRLA
jgi:hypothetical protein